MQLELQVANDGFAVMFNGRPVFAVLYQGAEQYPCQRAADPWTWRRTPEGGLVRPQPPAAGG